MYNSLARLNWGKELLSVSKDLPNLQIAGATEPPCIHRNCGIKYWLLESFSRLKNSTILHQKGYVVGPSSIIRRRGRGCKVELHARQAMPSKFAHAFVFWKELLEIQKQARALLLIEGKLRPYPLWPFSSCTRMLLPNEAPSKQKRKAASQ